MCVCVCVCMCVCMCGCAQNSTLHTILSHANLMAHEPCVQSQSDKPLSLK